LQQVIGGDAEAGREFEYHFDSGVPVAGLDLLDLGSIQAVLRCEKEATVEDLIRLAGVFEVEPGRLLEETD
jgi:hypothetical protein